MFFKVVLPTSACLLAMAVFGASSGMIPSVLIRASEDFGASPGMFANLTVLQFSSFILATIAGGIASDVFGKKSLLALASFSMFAGNVLWALASDFPMLFAANIFVGVGGGVIEGLCMALISDLFPDRRKLFMNLSQAAYCFGAVSGPFLIRMLMPGGVSWRWFFGGLAVSGLVLLALFSLSRIRAVPPDERVTFGKIKSLAGEWLFICPCLAIFLYVFTETCLGLFVNMYLQLYKGAPENWAIYSISIFWLCMLAGRLICAAIPESVSYRKILFCLFSTGGALVAAQYFFNDWRICLALFALAGFVFSGTWPLIVGMAASDNPGNSGTVVGLTVAVGAFGCVAASPVMNLLMSRFSPEASFGLISAPLFLGAALILATHVVVAWRAKKRENISLPAQ